MKGKGLGKRIVAYLLALVMVISMVGFQAGTVKADGSASGNATPIVDEGTSEEGVAEGTEEVVEGEEGSDEEVGEDSSDEGIGEEEDITDSNEEESEEENSEEENSADEESEDEEESGDEEESYPAFEASKEVAGTVVTVTAEEGVLPEGTELSVTPVTAADIMALFAEFADVDPEEVVAFDVVLSHEGEEIHYPEGSVTVTFSNVEVPEEESVKVYCMDENENIDQAAVVEVAGDEVTVEAPHFSIYAIVNKNESNKIYNEVWVNPGDKVDLTMEAERAIYEWSLLEDNGLKVSEKWYETPLGNQTYSLTIPEQGVDAGNSAKIKCVAYNMEWSWEKWDFEKKEVVDSSFEIHVNKTKAEFETIDNDTLEFTYTGNELDKPVDGLTKNGVEIYTEKSCFVTDSTGKTEASAPINASDDYYYYKAVTKENNLYTSNTKVFKIKINKATPKFEVTSVDDAYDGQTIGNIKFSYNCNVPGNAAWANECQNEVVDRDFWDRVFNFICEGWGTTTRRIVFTPEDTQNYNVVSDDGEFAVYKYGSSIDILPLTEEELVYTGSEIKGYTIGEIKIKNKTIELTKDNIDRLELDKNVNYYKIKDGTREKLDGAPSACGDYEVEVVLPTCRSDYAFSIKEKGVLKKLSGNGYAGSRDSVKFTITGKQMPKGDVSGYECTYDGEEHALMVESKVDGALVEYQQADGSYSGTSPAYTDAGTYTVKYRISKANYNTYEGSATLTINPKELKEEVITGKVANEYYKADAYTASDLTVTAEFGEVGLSFDVTEVDKDMTNPGEKHITIALTGNYAGTKNLTFYILGKKVKFYLDNLDGTYTEMGEGALRKEDYQKLEELGDLSKKQTFYTDNDVITEFVQNAVKSPLLKEDVKDGYYTFTKFCSESDGLHIDFQYTDRNNYDAPKYNAYVLKRGNSRPTELKEKEDKFFIPVD